MQQVQLYTIGFTRKSAEQFFELLRAHQVKRIIDVRANNTSQLSGFTKRDDLAFFARELLGAEYHHLDWLAPTPEIRATLTNRSQGWPAYEHLFYQLLRSPEVQQQLERRFFTELPSVLLCSEPTAEHCHRRLIAEHLQQRWPEIVVTHL